MADFHQAVAAHQAMLTLLRRVRRGNPEWEFNLPALTDASNQAQLYATDIAFVNQLRGYLGLSALPNNSDIVAAVRDAGLAYTQAS